MTPVHPESSPSWAALLLAAALNLALSLPALAQLRIGQSSGFSGAAAGCKPMPPGVGCPIKSSANAWTPQNADATPAEKVALEQKKNEFVRIARGKR